MQLIGYKYPALVFGNNIKDVLALSFKSSLWLSSIICLNFFSLSLSMLECSDWHIKGINISILLPINSCFEYPSK